MGFTVEIILVMDGLGAEVVDKGGELGWVELLTSGLTAIVGATVKVTEAALCAIISVMVGVKD